MASAAISAVTQIAASLLIAHTAKLKAAQAENAGIPSAVQAFDGDFQTIIQAYNNGQVSAAGAISALSQVDAGIKAYLKAQVGKAGTAWNETSGVAGKCDKTCSAGCCVYYGDLGPPLSLAMVALGGKGTFWGTSDPRYSAGPNGVTVQVPQVFASKYGGVNRAGYNVTILSRAAAPSNPVQYAQTGLPAVPVRTGLVSEGTPNGSTSTFSVQTQGQLVNAALGVLPAAQPMPVPGVSSSSNVILIGAGVLIAGLIVVLALK